MNDAMKKGKKLGQKGLRVAQKNNGRSIELKMQRGPPIIVGIGASAGGLDAFTQLLKHLPVDTGMGFVLVQHLDPKHESILAHLLGLTTKMPVQEAAHNLRIEANHVYIIPPNTTMGLAEGRLTLKHRKTESGQHHPIDWFFEALARERGGKGIGIILSGNASDGTKGLEVVKRSGGITFAQDESAKHHSMPQSAIASGCVDFVLPPEKIAWELGRIARDPDAEKIALAKPAVLKAAETTNVAKPKGEALEPIFLLLRNQFGVDFTVYKASTIERRIARRMVLSQRKTVAEYTRLLTESAKELELLHSDLLVGVTSFFRNPEAFGALRFTVFPELLENRRQDEPLRVWALGCSTGQEAYSIAMAYTEFCDKIAGAPKLQIFATDLNEAALEKARRGLYPKNGVEHVSPERLKRFFVEEETGYRVSKSLRELCVFARQNVLSDPPFSRMDLISCRNLLIYVELGSQKKVLPNFHYALKTGGFLMLGASESVGTYANLFAVVDKRQKIFCKKPGRPATYEMPVSRGAFAGGRRMAGARPEAATAEFRGGINAQREADRVMVNHYAPPSVVINSELEILQFRGATGAFLEAPSGKASFNLLKMVRGGLALPLRSAITAARKRQAPACVKDVRLEGKPERRVNIEVVPLKNLKERSYLVLFVERFAAEKDLGGTVRARGTQLENKRVAELERELAEARDYAQALQEDHEGANEELQASHEEGQSANEELQSIVEELETSKEELESTNEELTTVNEEMGNRNIELNQLNGDLANLQSSTKLAIVLLGRDLSIRRFSAEAEKELNLLPTDVGRPMGKVRHNLSLPDLEGMITEVIATVQEREREVRNKSGRWFLLKVRPYLTVEKIVDGATMVLIDISAVKESELAVKAARDFAEAIIRTARDPFVILDAKLRVERANEAFYTTFKLTRGESVGRPIFELDRGQWDIPKLRELLKDILPRHSFFNSFEVTHEFGAAGKRTMLLNARALSEASGQPARILLGIQDVTEMLHFQSQMRRSELRYRRLFEASRDGVLLLDPVSGRIVDANPFMSELLGYPYEQLLGKELFEIGLLKDEEASQAAFAELKKKGMIRYEDLPLETKNGERREVEFISNLYQEGISSVIQCNIRDVTARRVVERQLSEKARLLDLSNDAIMVRGLDDKISLWNKGAEKMYGWTAEEAHGQHMHTMLKTEFPKSMQQIVAHLYEKGNFSGEITQITKDGRRVQTLCRWVLDKDTKSILTSYTDLSAHKLAQAALLESEKRYQSLFDSIDEGFCVIEMIFDADGRAVDYRFLEVNPSFKKQTGMDALGKRMRELAPDHEEDWFEIYGKVALTGEPIRFENEAKALNRWFDVYAFRVDAPERGHVAVLFTNVTERKATEEQLRLAQRKLADRAAELEELVAERTVKLRETVGELEALTYTVAHNLRAPLRGINGMCQALREDYGDKLDAAGKDFAVRAAAGAVRMDALIRDLIIYAKVMQAETPLAPVDIAETVGRAVGKLSVELTESRAHVNIELPAELPAAMGHMETLEMVLQQLIGNALKFAKEDQDPVITIGAAVDGHHVRVTVTDQGIGLAPEHHARVFWVFERLEPESRTGTGIGLAIVEKAARRMGGTCGVTSAPGHGSSFWIELTKADGARIPSPI